MFRTGRNQTFPGIWVQEARDSLEAIAAGVNLLQLAGYSCATVLGCLSLAGKLDWSTLTCRMAREEQVTLTDSTPRLHTIGRSHSSV